MSPRTERALVAHPAVSRRAMRPLEDLDFDTRVVVDVHSARALDELGRLVAAAHEDGRLRREEAETLILWAVPGSRIIYWELARAIGTDAADRLVTEIEPRVERRLTEKVVQTAYLDITRLGTVSAASWARSAIRRLVWDALRPYRQADGTVRQVVSVEESEPVAIVAERALAQMVADASERDRQWQILETAEATLLHENGTRRRTTWSAKIHAAATVLSDLGDWPELTVPLTWAERDETRRLLEADATAAMRSLTRGDTDVPVALERLWDGFDPETRALLAQDPHTAHVLALAAVTPFPRPSRTQTFTRFTRRVAALSEDVRWRAAARGVADEFVATFVDLATVQSRAGATTTATRRATAEDGRRHWDDLMRQHRMPDAVAVVAPTGTDLVEVLTAVWWQAVRDTERAAAS